MKIFIASSELFSGFNVVIDVEKCNSMDDIINIFVDNLRKCLEIHNFEILLEKLKTLNFHIHDYTFNDILTGEDKFYYICDHC